MKETIVINAWKTVSELFSLKKLNFFPSFFGMLWFLIIIFYQTAFAFISLFNQKDRAISMLYQFLHTSYFIEAVVSILMIFLLYVLSNPIAKGGIINMIHLHKKSEGEKYCSSFQGLFDGFRHFLVIFELQNIIAIFSPLTIITSYIFALRLFGSDFYVFSTVIMGIYLLFAFVLNMCFSYAPFFAIFEGKKGSKALSASTSMALGNIRITARLYFTNIILYLRVLLVGAFFFFIPFLISSILAYFTLTIVKTIALWIFILIAFLLFLLIVQLNSAMEIFVLSIWYEAYIACKKENEFYAISSNNDDDDDDDEENNEYTALL